MASLTAPDHTSTSGTYISICGPIGVGKSTLAEHLAADLGAVFIREQFDDAANSFIRRFYAERAHGPVPDGTQDTSDTPTWSLATALSFLVQRTDLVRDITVLLAQGRSIVADWAAPQSLIFSRLTLPTDEFALYESLYTRLMEQTRLPDLLVALDAPVTVLQARISGRARSMESGLAPSYLAALRLGYAAWRDNPPAPLLWLDTTNLNAQDAHSRNQALAQIKAHLELVRHSKTNGDTFIPDTPAS